MPMLASLVAAFLSAGVPGSVFAYRRLKTRREERAVRVDLASYLDRLIQQAETRDPPFEDLSLHRSSDEDGVVRSRAYFIYFADFTHVHLSGSRPFLFRNWPTRYAIDFKRPALQDDRFPGYGRTCRSAWFVERMEKLLGLLDAYPREELAKVKRERAYQARQAEWDAFDKEVDEMLDAYEEKEEA